MTKLEFTTEVQTRTSNTLQYLAISWNMKDTDIEAKVPFTEQHT